jgi:hypothetical protein
MVYGKQVPGNQSRNWRWIVVHQHQSGPPQELHRIRNRSSVTSLYLKLYAKRETDPHRTCRFDQAVRSTVEKNSHELRPKATGRTVATAKCFGLLAMAVGACLEASMWAAPISFMRSGTLGGTTPYPTGRSNMSHFIAMTPVACTLLMAVTVLTACWFDGQ